MTVRFFHRFRIAPGVTLNLSKKNVSVSVGPRGARYTTGTAGDRATLGLTGTGLFVTEKIKRTPSPPQVVTQPVSNIPWTAIILIGVVLVVLLVIL